jgi:hypothetical protein
MAGCFAVRATRKVTTHLVFLRGATSRPDTMLHVPVSLQVFLPVEIVVKSAPKVVRDRNATTDFFTVKPGRAFCTNVLADTFPVGDFVTMEKA